MELAIHYAHETSPGPDGIPYLAFKKVPESAPILYEAAKALLDGHAPPDDFNYGFLPSLPAQEATQGGP